MRIRIIQTALPWIIASFCCIVFVAFSMALIVLQTDDESVATKEVKKSVESFLPRDPLTSRMGLTLALSPNDKKDVPLVASMIENHEDARPHQAGLREAIVIFEMIVEGDISRFLALYRSDKLPDSIGPIRSLRPHFISIIRGYKPLLLHAGGSQFAYDALERFPDIPNHDGIRFDGETYDRKDVVDPPHNLFMRKAPLLSVLEQEKPQTVSLPLYPTTRKNPEGGETAHNIKINFGSKQHDVTIRYKSLQNIYIRSLFEASRQAIPKNIVVIETYIDGFNQPGYIPWTQTFGEGKMLLFRNGKVYRGTWRRDKGESFEFIDEHGYSLPLAPGQVWITLLPSLNAVKWE